jgi:hypothetical protein
MIAAVFALAVGFAEPPVANLSVKADGRPFGQMEYSHFGTKDGSRTVRWKIRQIEDNAALTISDEQTWDRAGRPRTFKRLMTGPDGNTIVTAKFTNDGVEVSFSHAGLKETESYSAPARKSLINPTVFWFAEFKPKPGTKATVSEFDFDEMEWVVKTITYTGPEKIQSGGKTITANRLDYGVSETIWVDDTGYPVKATEKDGTTTLAMERIWPVVVPPKKK